MKIVIPMAGHSRRFQKAGYQIPKPFLPIGDKTMIEQVCRMFSSSDHFIFVVHKDHYANPSYRAILERATPYKDIVPIDSHENGPLFTALSADPFMQPEEPVLLSYCDFVVRWDYRRFLLKAAMSEGAIPVFKGFHPASFGTTFYAYIRANEKDEMLELRETILHAEPGRRICIRGPLLRRQMVPIQALCGTGTTGG